MVKENKNNYLILLFLFVAFTAILFFAPHAVDDTYYDYLNMSSFTDILKFSAGYGNGRALGNMLAVYLCKSRLIAAVIRGLSITSVVFLVTKLINDKANNVLLICMSLLMFGVGAGLFRSVYAWISAFANYLPPIICVLSCLLMIKKSIYDKTSPLLSCVLVFVLGYSGQLFTENSTLNNFAISFLLLVLAIWKKQDKLVPFVYFIATGLGSATMVALRLFCHDERGIYDSVNYEVQTKSIWSVLNSAINHYFNFSDWTSHWIVMIIAIQIAIFFILKNTKSDTALLNKIKAPLFLCTLLRLLTSVVHCFVDNGYVYYLNVLSFTLYLPCLFLLLFYIDKKKRQAYFFTFLFMFFTASYLLVLEPISDRILYYTYIVLSVLVIILWTDMVENISEKALKYIEAASKGVLLVMSAVVLSIYVNIYNMDNKVNDFIDLQINSGKEEVYICPLTKTDFFSSDYPRSRLRWIHYKNEPDDVKFVEVDVDEWKKIYDEWNNGKIG